MTDNSNLHKRILIHLDRRPIIFDYISNGIIITDDHSLIIYTNSAFTKITHYSAEEAREQNPGILHSGCHSADFYKKMWLQITNHGFWEGEIWNRKKTGEIYPELLTISKVTTDGKDYYIGIFSDISFLKKDLHKKLHLALYDPLTELPNRSLYFDRANQIIEKRKNRVATIFFMDLDKFKLVNDSYGHCVGDKLLKEVSKRLSSIVKVGDTIARIGGDEFTAFLTSVKDNKSAYKFAQRIVDLLEKPFMVDRHQINISISIGISFYPKDAVDVEKLLINADKAMYLAKKNGLRIADYEQVNS